MKLYKNVDICDIESILKNGILSLDESGNNNWLNGKRQNNSTDVVYLFKPKGKVNTFPKSYGIALLEVEIDDAEVIENALREYDIHKDDYIEYITRKVSPEKIKRVLIPSIFKDRVKVIFSKSTIQKVGWCEMVAEKCVGILREEGQMFGGELIYEAYDKNALETFAKTTELNSNDFNFFRGINSKHEIIDLYNIEYIF